MGSGASGGAVVLVVDDYDDARETCAEYLAVCGFRVEQARDGASALARARAAVPDVVLLDLTLPDMDGASVARRLREDPRTARVAIVLLTGHHLDEAGGARHLCDAHLLKPCPAPEIVRTIERLLARAPR